MNEEMNEELNEDKKLQMGKRQSLKREHSESEFEEGWEDLPRKHR